MSAALPAIKPILTPEAAAELIPDGATLLVGGFMGVGAPHRVLRALARAGRRGLTIISNDATRPGQGVGLLSEAGAVARLITSHIGLNPRVQQAMLAGELEVELVPQGTLIERIRAGGFGLGGVLTPTGLGTAAAQGQRTIDIDGRTWLLALPLKADFALVAAEQADYAGNLQYQLTATNFNPIIAMAATTVIAQPREILPVGSLPPDTVKTPGVLVNYLIAREETAP